MSAAVRHLLIPLLLSCFVVFNTWFAITFITDPARTIVVTNRLESKDGNGYLKKYHVINTPKAEYEIMVQAKTFEDHLMLPKHGENLLSLFCQVLGGSLLLWYFLATDEQNAFDKNKMRLVSWGVMALFLAAGAYNYGQLAAKTYWSNIYSYDAKNYLKSDFFVETNSWLVMVSIFAYLVLNFIIQSYTERNNPVEEKVKET